MNMSKHTPGPWKILYGAMEGDQYFTIASRMVPGVIAEYAVPCPRPADEVHANARLIAASPTLLDIAKEIAHSQCDLGDSERRIRLYQAIREATGSLETI